MPDPSHVGADDREPADLAPVPAHPRKLAVLGSPQEAALALSALVDAGFEVPLVVSRPDTRRGRGKAPSPTALKEAATTLGIPVTDQLGDVVDAEVDLGVVVAYGRLVPTEVLARVPMVNVHFSLLPRWRGAAPVERAILAGDRATGVCVMRLEPELDTGAVYRRAEVVIEPDETAADLRSRLAELGASILVGSLQEGLTDPQPQEGEATYAAKILTDELRIDWERPPAEVQRLVRVGGAWTTFRSKRLKVHVAHLPTPGSPDRPPHDLGSGEVSGAWVGAGGGALELDVVQVEGRAPVSVDAWLRGARPAVGERLGP